MASIIHLASPQTCWYIASLVTQISIIRTISQATLTFTKTMWVTVVVISKSWRWRLPVIKQHRLPKRYWLSELNSYRYILYKALWKWKFAQTWKVLKENGRHGHIDDWKLVSRLHEARWSAVFRVWATEWESHAFYQANVEGGLCFNSSMWRIF